MNLIEFLENIIAKNQVFEIRAKIKDKNYWRRGYFDYDHIKTAGAQLMDLFRSVGGEKNIEGVYFTPNSVNPDLLHRCMNQIKSGESTKDCDIIAINYILIDFDPIRASGISSTDDEKKEAYSVMKKVTHELSLFGINPCVIGDSGNGYHLMLKNDDCSSQHIIAFLNAISNTFSTEKVSIDKKVGNPSRIWKLYCTHTRKGSDSKVRPWRQSKVVNMDMNVEPVTADQLNLFTSTYTEPVQMKVNAQDTVWYNHSGSPRDYLERFIQLHLNTTGHKNLSNGELWEIDCPFNSEHKKKGYIMYKDGSGWSYKCHHSSCSGYGWKELKNMFEPERERVELPKLRSKPKEETECREIITSEEFNEPIENVVLRNTDTVTFPFSVFPEFILEAIDVISEETQSSKEMVANLMIGAYSGACSNKFKVDIVSQPLNLYMAIKMPSSSRKSEAYNAIFLPFGECQKTVYNQYTSKLNSLKECKASTKRFLSNAVKASLSSDSSNNILSEMNEKIVNIDSEIEELKSKKCNKFIVDDVTVERMVKLLEQNNERLVLSSSEGSPLSNIIRTYGNNASSKPSIDLYLKAYSGEYYQFSRVTGDVDVYLNPFLTIVITGQDDDMDEFFSNNFLIKRGLISRFLFVSPKVVPDINFMKVSNYVNNNAYRKYVNHISDIILNNYSEIIKPSQPGFDRYVNYSTMLHKEYKNIGGKEDDCNYSLKYWIGKQHMRMVRLSGILKVMSSNGIYHDLYITDQDILRAELLSDYYIKSFNKSTSYSDKYLFAKRLYNIARLKFKTFITKGDIRRYVTRGVSLSKHREVIDWFIQYGFLRGSQNMSGGFQNMSGEFNDCNNNGRLCINRWLLTPSAQDMFREDI